MNRGKRLEKERGKEGGELKRQDSPPGRRESRPSSASSLQEQLTFISPSSPGHQTQAAAASSKHLHLHPHHHRPSDSRGTSSTSKPSAPQSPISKPSSCSSAVTPSHSSSPAPSSSSSPLTPRPAAVFSKRPPPGVSSTPRLPPSSQSDRTKTDVASEPGRRLQPGVRASQGPPAVHSHSSRGVTHPAPRDSRTHPLQERWPHGADSRLSSDLTCTRSSMPTSTSPLLPSPTCSPRLSPLSCHPHISLTEECASPRIRSHSR
ncbi:hypothetical protein CgunFtcFv8_009290 [Champsocephalus gunnari]|uniref:Uncharacterized protein n=1 Tax=Champsocephalus gunnari TaxID=52237 RepID=A0AAN8GY21_CHAGU|nr:hypothetical protein CgunFtcFv8_009290 [Champsocephalus gunnari]